MCRVKNAIAGITLLFLLMGLVSFASAGTTRDDRDDEDYLELGTLYPSVGRIIFGTDSGLFGGSGTLIADDWVLTAGHVVDEANWLDFTIGGDTYSADKWIPYQSWKGDLLAGRDIGLINLSSPVENVQPAQRYQGSEELLAEATFVGYGTTGTGLTGAIYPGGEKRAGQNVIDVLYGRGKKQRLFLTDFDNPNDPSDSVFGSTEPLDLEFLVSFGDSGGGVFIEGESGPLLAGVNSFIGLNEDGITCGYGDISGHTRVSVFNRWIDRTIAGRGRGRPSRSLPSGLEANLQLVPEPATLLLLALGGLALLKRKRKSA